MNSYVMGRIEEAIPLNIVPQYDLKGRRAGFVIIDEVEGFCAPGKGNLAPPAGKPTPKAIADMVRETELIARNFMASELPILVFCDTHEPDIPEPPYPPHCIRGSGEECLVPELRYLETMSLVTVIRKNCINGFVGAMQADGNNEFFGWVNRHRLEVMVVGGICTDICDADLVATTLSARNHYVPEWKSTMFPNLRDVVVCVPACSTYDLPREAALAAGLPAHAAHPAELMHYIGLYMMASRGAILARALAF